MTPEQTSLDEKEYPREVECDGASLPATIQAIKKRGGIVLAMGSVQNARWRLSLSWPNQPLVRDCGHAVLPQWGRLSLSWPNQPLVLATSIVIAKGGCVFP